MQMHTLIDKDLRRWWNDRNAVVVALLLPLVLTCILGLSFGGFGGDAGLSKIPLAVVGNMPSMARQFVDVLPEAAERLEALVAGLPAVERLADTEVEAMGTVVAEIVDEA